LKPLVVLVVVVVGVVVVVWCGGGGGGDGDDEWKFRLLRLIRPSATELVNACDAGREGELIFREIYEQSNSKLPFKRLWISSLTDEAIQEGYDLSALCSQEGAQLFYSFQKLQDGAKYDPLYRSALARVKADW